MVKSAVTTESKKKHGSWSRHYYDPKRVGSYSGAGGFVRGLKQKSKKSGKRSVNALEVKKWLRGQDAYSLHKTPRRRFKRRKTIVSGPNEQWQCDLIDFSGLKKHNKDMTFVLTVIDVFSKVAFAEPLKNKTSLSVIEGLKKVFKKAGRVPRKLQTDKGREFTNQKVQAYLKERGVGHFVSENDDIKCGIVERFNRTLKERVWRYFTHHETYHYLKALPSMVGAYNRSYHRSNGL